MGGFGSTGQSVEIAELKRRAERIIYFVVNGQGAGAILDEAMCCFAAVSADRDSDLAIAVFSCCVEALRKLAPLNPVSASPEFPALAAFYRLDLEARIAFALVSVEGASYRKAGEIMRKDQRETARLVSTARRSFLSIA